MSEFIRVNTRISATTNEWLDEKSSDIGVSKSALINLAIESYIEQKEAIGGLNQLLQAVERLEKKVEEKELND